MATVPIRPYQRQVGPQGGFNPPRASGADPIGAGLRGVGAALGDIAQTVQRDLAIAENAQATLRMATLNNDLRDLHDEVSRSITDGGADPEGAMADFRSRADSMQEAAFRDLNPRQRGMIADNAATTRGGVERSLAGALIKRQQTDTAAAIDQFGEQAQRSSIRVGPAVAAEKFGAFVDFSGSAAGLNAEQQAKLKQNFAERVHYGYFETLGTDALTRGDAAGIDAVRARLAGTEGDVLDPLKRTQLTHQLFGWAQSIRARMTADEQKALRERNALEQAASSELDKALDLTLRGQYLSPAYIKQLTATVAGTGYEQPVVQLLAAQDGVAGFASRSSADRAAILDRMRALGATPGTGTSPEGAKILGSMTKIDNALREQARDNPWEAAQAAGAIQHAPEFDARDPAAVLGIVQQRMPMIRQVEDWAGRRVSPLQPREAEQFATAVRTLPPDQQATLLGALGTAIGDTERVADVAKQINDKDGTLGLAMSYANAQTTLGRATAELILRGEQAIKDKAVKVDGTAEAGWRATIASQIRGAYANQALENKVIDAAFLIAAGNARAAIPGVAGQQSTDIDRAVRLASGGIIEFNGARVPLPPGFAAEGQSDGEKRFTKAIESIDPESLYDQVPRGIVRLGNVEVPLNQFVRDLPKAQLVHAGQGLYNVKAGTSLATNVEGRRITLRIAP